MERTRRRRWLTGAVLAFAFISSVHALSHDEMREPVVKFIDFYIATQDADAPPMSFWERVIYSLALTRDARGRE